MNTIKKDNLKIFIAGCSIGLLFFMVIYGYDALNFTNDILIIDGYIERDIMQHYSGWMLYRNSPWQFPLGLGQNIAYPYGSAVSFTDSIPLFAIFFKIFRNILPSTFQYFGLFVLICFMLQGGFGALLTSIFNKKIFITTFASSLYVLCPIIIERAFRHCGLTAHFLIIASLYYYFKNKSITGISAYIPFIIINALSITIHPYFMPFTFGIMFAFCLERFFIDKERILSILLLVFSILLTIAVGYIIGLFSFSGSASSIGYGSFSMNLNAVINPISKGISNWSRFFGERPFVVEWQIEGFNYLGLGIFIFIFISGLLFVFTYKREFIKVIINFISQYFGIIFSVSALTIFALGDTITFGGLKLFKLPFTDYMINNIFGVFRANGRFGWLLVYIIITFIIYVISKIDNQKVSYIMFAAVLSIQLYDISGALISKYNYFHNIDCNLQQQKLEPVLKHPIWEDLAENYNCIYVFSGGPPNGNIYIASRFGASGKAVNANFTARYDTESLKLEDVFYTNIADGSFNKNIIMAVEDVKDEYKTAIKEAGLDIYYVEDFVLIFDDSKIHHNISKYENCDNFIIYDYPYNIELKNQYNT